MDRQFLEFWGNFLLQVAKGQQQWETLIRGLQGGFFNLGPMTSMFQKAYGLEGLDQDSPDYMKMWKKAEEDFRDSFKDFLNLMGMVPRHEHAALALKYEELKEKVADQEETIKHLRLLLEDKGVDFGMATVEFQELIKKQTRQTQEFLQGLKDLFMKSNKQD